MRKISIISHISYFLFFLLVSMACCEKDKNIDRNKNLAAGSEKHIMPQIPLIITDRSEQINYLADHYWDGFNFSDTINIGTSAVEKYYIEYINILNQVPPGMSKDAISKLMVRCELKAKVFMRFFSLSEKYLYDPNSSLRNEVLYIEILRSIIDSKKLPDVYKIRPRNQYNLACRNIPGSKAADFEFKTVDGTRGFLHKIKSPYLLIYFNNPDCGDCKRVCALLKESTAINSSINSGMLKILSVYPDEDITVWKKESSSIPFLWINSFNPDGIIMKNNIYDLKAIPSLYLLDYNKRVILKDALFEDVERFVTTNIKSKNV
ncbi:MAG: hypothetical protein H6Q12_226 [Bacteroidetes bacterium]|nr:hypothetical protein [Bacteroidota bacterium]